MVSNPQLQKTSSTNALIVQPKLTVNTPGDRYEREADAMADRIMRMPSGGNLTTPSLTPLSGNVQRKCAACEEEERLQRKESTASTPIVTPSLSAQLSSTRGRGATLPVTTQSLMNQAFGTDFSGVRVHTDGAAAAMSQQLNARAFTHGSDIYFNRGEYTPEAPEGKRLLGHELTHVVQQGNARKGIQRAPLFNELSDTESLHDDLTLAYSKEAGIANQPGLQYSPDYEQWLRARTGTGAQFQGHSTSRENPLERQKKGESAGKTFFKINGNLPQGATVGDLIEDYKKLITPTNIRQHFAEDSGQPSCRFDYQFQLNTAAEIIVATAPGRNGWQANMNPNQVLTPPLLAQFPDCATTASTAVTLRGDPSDQAYHDLIRDSELEHVAELKTLHERHFVPFYQFAMGLVGTGTSTADCEKDLHTQLGKRNEQAALGFVLGDMAATQRFDAQTSTHHGDMQAVVGNQCSTITLTSKQRNPQDPQREPGNVKISPPATQAVQSGSLQVQGTTLSDGQGFSQTFSDAQTANQALTLFQQLNVTHIHTLGPLQILIHNGQAAAGAVSPASELALHTNLYQVTANLTGQDQWSITEVQGDAPLLILDFGADRDQAYSAVKAMRETGVNRQVWSGAIDNPDFLFFVG